MTAMSAAATANAVAGVVAGFVSFVFKLSYVLNGRVISFGFDAEQMLTFPLVDIVGIGNSGRLSL